MIRNFDRKSTNKEKKFIAVTYKIGQYLGVEQCLIAGSSSVGL